MQQFMVYKSNFKKINNMEDIWVAIDKQGKSICYILPRLGH